ncbi:hypothetical protein L484_005395 [Morus notabilis]|uniref:PORR domain-containing protein n=1 Tax=Morus notabilis TaxID=981085 RepID=W9S6D0_9ROSA|nr:hypothetical protein L484_005395 [Morus notabilis]
MNLKPPLRHLTPALLCPMSIFVAMRLRCSPQSIWVSFSIDIVVSMFLRITSGALSSSFRTIFELWAGRKRGCWNSFAGLMNWGTSIMEKKAMGGDSDYAKGMPIAFFLCIFLKGFEMDKKLKKWVNYWQKLPYVSP